mmetsp:Transcript_16212/g.29151  ORF Transcript_16212/g.29151 Transcript_16212/m.29151 type:complete len:312 (-) Transcript_16212:90-1025(-)
MNVGDDIEFVDEVIQMALHVFGSDAQRQHLRHRPQMGAQLLLPQIGRFVSHRVHGRRLLRVEDDVIGVADQRESREAHRLGAEADVQQAGHRDVQQLSRFPLDARQQRGGGLRGYGQGHAVDEVVGLSRFDAQPEVFLHPREDTADFVQIAARSITHLAEAEARQLRAQPAGREEGGGDQHVHVCRLRRQGLANEPFEFVENCVDVGRRRHLEQPLPNQPHADRQTIPAVVDSLLVGWSCAAFAPANESASFLAGRHPNLLHEHQCRRVFVDAAAAGAYHQTVGRLEDHLPSALLAHRLLSFPLHRSILLP